MRFYTFLLLFCSYSFSFSQVTKSVALGSSMTLGNLNSININAQAAFSKDTGRINWNINPMFNYTLVKEATIFKTFERESFLTASISKRYGKWKLIGFCDMENSYLRKVLYRVSSGLGAGITIYENSKCKATISEVLMPEYFLSDDISRSERFSIRASTRLKLKYSGKVNFESISFFQPALWTTGNLRITDNLNFRTTNTLDIPLSKKISVGAQFVMSLFTLPHYLDKTVKISDSRLSILLKFNW